MEAAQHDGWISGLRLRAATATLMLAIGLVLATIATPAAHGQTYKEKVLYTFTGGTDGAFPYAGLIQDAAGNLYGTTQQGGVDPYGYCASNGFNGCGVVFRLNTSGTEAVLYSFAGGSDGAGPTAGLTQDAAGNLYGTTVNGGNLSCDDEGGGSGCGVVFKLDTAGTETALYKFCVNGPPCADGAYPYASLIRDAAGNLYGTTEYGGVGGGTVFKVDTSGKEAVLYSFQGPPDGQFPYASLIRDGAGNLYGSLFTGGDGCGAEDCGALFKLDTSGKETILHEFHGYKDGGLPYAGLIMDSAGNLYGTTVYDGGGFSEGTVFKLDTGGKNKALHIFTGGTDGGYPYAGLVFDKAGNLYGTTSAGGRRHSGVVFKLSKARRETVLHTFSGADGAGPKAALLRDAAGNLYGTTVNGGTTSCGGLGCGVVFELIPQ
jgi:uncharacterized repeat protein (TIGR03803 family)